MFYKIVYIYTTLIDRNQFFMFHHTSKYQQSLSWAFDPKLVLSIKAQIDVLVKPK